jgi:hypothetical protein
VMLSPPSKRRQQSGRSRSYFGIFVWGTAVFQPWGAFNGGSATAFN